MKRRKRKHQPLTSPPGMVYIAGTLLRATDVQAECAWRMNQIDALPKEIREFIHHSNHCPVQRAKELMRNCLGNTILVLKELEKYDRARTKDAQSTFEVSGGRWRAKPKKTKWSNRLLQIAQSAAKTEDLLS
jgi:hypothetical protein